jgi:hypothetical protein
LDKAEHFGERAQRVVRGRLSVRKTTGDLIAPAALVPERPELRRARVRTELLIGELDSDGLAGTLELDLFSYHLAKPSYRLKVRVWTSLYLTSS